MQCSCDAFDIETLIDSPDRLTRILKKAREAVDSGVLSYNDFHSGRELIGQPSFLTISLDSDLPDAIRYLFDCPKCTKRYALGAETCHGAGGKWLPI